MKYNELSAKRQTKPTRKGRGISAGEGKTAGRGTKGQGSRKSGGVRPGFEGGQMPLYMRLPKLRGFKSHQLAPETAYTGQLAEIKKQTIDNAALAEAGIVSSPYVAVKVVLRGELGVKKDVKLQGASKAAIAAIEKAGGTFQPIVRHGRPNTKKTSPEA